MSSSDTPPPSSGGLPVASDEIIMLSLPDTQDAGEPTAAADVDFCDAPEAVDLGKDSQLGFSEVQGEGKCGVGGDDSGENRNRHIHPFEKENSDLGCCTGVQPEQTKKGVDKGKEKLVSENDGVDEVNKGTGVEGAFENLKRVLPPSVRGGEENVASEGDGARKITVFDLLRALTKPMGGEEDDNNPNLMDATRAIGIDFPRPRWYPKGHNP